MGVLEGYKVCILAYGQSGSGKTCIYNGNTGHLNDEKSWGVNPRALHDLFKIKEERAKEGTHFEVSIKMVEIYNNRVRDLFDSAHKELKVRSQGDDQLPDATSFLVNSSDAVFTYMEFGQANRAVGATKLNESRSRSHSVLKVTVVGRQLDQQSCIMGCLQLVDLAGSEKLDQPLVVGKNEEHIPYRNCKLTEVLQGSLAPKSRVLTFIHMRPESGACQETLNTLKFSQRIGSVELGNAQVHTKKKQAKYYVDEVKEKSGKDIDVSSWKFESVEDLPKQETGFDCGVFMIKYADFYSRTWSSVSTRNTCHIFD